MTKPEGPWQGEVARALQGGGRPGPHPHGRGGGVRGPHRGPPGPAQGGGSLEGGRAYQTQVLAFFQELTEAVKVAPRVALVMTIPSSAPYGEEGERALLQLQRIAGRLERSTSVKLGDLRRHPHAPL